VAVKKEPGEEKAPCHGAAEEAAVASNTPNSKPDFIF